MPTLARWDCTDVLISSSNELGGAVEWMELPGKKASRIKVSLPGDFNAKDKWNDYFQWLLSEAEKFYKVFPKYLVSGGQ